MAEAALSSAALPALSAEEVQTTSAIMMQRIAGMALDSHVSETSTLAYMQTHGGINRSQRARDLLMAHSPADFAAHALAQQTNRRSKPVNERTRSEGSSCTVLSAVDATAPASCGLTGGSRRCAPRYCDFGGVNVAQTSVRFLFYGR